ncbi:hypothetical protein BBJ28_00008216 [Nothophytophthora sp. Chile5]|nr:hypothetical protein BBJ28_00008216 [Nothophytophthora sp. Chile5]
MLQITPAPTGITYPLRHEVRYTPSRDRPTAMALGWIAPIVLVGVCLLSLLWTLLSAPRFKVRGLHVLITGASLGPLLFNRQELTLCSKRSCELTDQTQMEQAVAEANAFHERPTDHLVYAAAVSMAPGYFWEQDIAQMRAAMDVNYHGAVVLIKSALPAMIEAKVRGRVVFVSTVDSLAFAVGSSACSGSKSALRGLADSLRNELQLYNISVSVFYPGKFTFNLLESSTTSEPTTDAADSVAPSDDRWPHPFCSLCRFDKEAQVLVNGLWAGQYSITTTWNGFLLRLVVNGVAPRNNTPLEFMALFFVSLYQFLVNIVQERSLKAPKAAGIAAHV